MNIILTNSKDATADYLIGKLPGIPLLRVDTDTVLERATFSFRTALAELTIDRPIRPDEVWNIWYRRPEPLQGPGHPSPESGFLAEEWAEAIEGFLQMVPAARWINYPSANANASHKLEQLARAITLGFTVPDTLVTQEPSAFRDFFAAMGGRVIAKPLASGHVKRADRAADSVIFTNAVEPTDAETSLEDLQNCPTLFQRLIDKESDVRITVLDDDIHAVEMRGLDNRGKQKVDIRRDNMEDVQYTLIEAPSSVKDAIRRMMASYSLRFAAIDMAVARDGTWYFLENNPNGQWAWMDQVGCSSIWESFRKSLSR